MLGQQIARGPSPPSSSSRGRRCRRGPSRPPSTGTDVHVGPRVGASTPSQRVIECARGSRSAASRGMPCAISALAHESSTETCDRGAVVAEPVAAAVADPRRRRAPGRRPPPRRTCTTAGSRATRPTPPRPRPRACAATHRSLQLRRSSTRRASPAVRAGGGRRALRARRARPAAAASDATSLSVVDVTPSQTTSTIRSSDDGERERVLVAGVHAAPCRRRRRRPRRGCSVVVVALAGGAQTADRAPAVGVDHAAARAVPRASARALGGRGSASTGAVGAELAAGLGAGCGRRRASAVADGCPAALAELVAVARSPRRNCGQAHHTSVRGRIALAASTSWIARLRDPR